MAKISAVVMLCPQQTSKCLLDFPTFSALSRVWMTTLLLFSEPPFESLKPILNRFAHDAPASSEALGNLEVLVNQGRKRIVAIAARRHGVGTHTLKESRGDMH